MYKIEENIVPARSYIIKEKGYDSPILRITVQILSGEAFLEVERFLIEESYDDRLFKSVKEKLEDPLLIDVSCNERIMKELDNVSWYNDSSIEDEATKI